MASGCLVAPEPKGKALYVAVFSQTGNFRPLINNKRNNGYVIGTVESVHAKEKKLDYSIHLVEKHVRNRHQEWRWGSRVVVTV